MINPYNDVGKPDDRTEDFLGCLRLRWSTANDIRSTDLNLNLNRSEPLAALAGIVEY